MHPGQYYTSNPENILVQENGLNFLVDITRGQKTGFYCDQRNNRENIRHLFKHQKSDQAPHKKYRVLDTFCYTGGFAMNAALGGADYILGIDSSEAALGLAQENAQKNNLGDKIKFEKHDVEYFLTHLAAKTLNPPQEPFDLIILDAFSSDAIPVHLITKEAVEKLTVKKGLAIISSILALYFFTIPFSASTST